jgi:hypothetical protein
MKNGADKELESSGRWWESYLVRYGLGTIIGACCVYFLLNYIGGENYLNEFYLAPSMGAEKQLKITEACLAGLGTSNAASGDGLCKVIVESQLKSSIDISTIFLLGILGFAYCYIASAPGLVIHGVRQQIVLASSVADSKKKTYYSDLGSGLSFAYVGAASFGVAYCFLKLECQIFFVCLLLMAFVVFIGLQIFWLGKVCRSNKLLSFYKCLHVARESGVIDPNSYKHLREHGNAFFIVLLEVVFLLLCIGSFSLYGLRGLLAMACLWILPGALIYFLGHKIEAEMMGELE